MMHYFILLHLFYNMFWCADFLFWLLVNVLLKVRLALYYSYVHGHSHKINSVVYCVTCR